MPQQEAFRDLPCKQVTYCRYGHPYRKLTWFATDLGEFWQPPRFARPKTCAPRRWGHGTRKAHNGGLARPAVGGSGGIALRLNSIRFLRGFATKSRLQLPRLSVLLW